MKNFLIFIFLITGVVFSQETFRVMTYNILNYPSKIASKRNPYFKTVIKAANPDILIVQEMESIAGVNMFYERVLDSNYSIGEFIDGKTSQGYDDTDNAIYYKDSLFTFLDNYPIDTDLRDISQFTLVHNSTNDTLIIYSAHLKASQGAENEQKRLREAKELRKVTDKLPDSTYFILVGDFNLYSSGEPSYKALLNKDNSGYFLDPLNMAGSWHNNNSYRSIHTQSTRREHLSDQGSTGGLDDRFDFILISQTVKDEGGITYLNDSYTAFGNDKDHFNKALLTLPNSAVSDEVATALYYSSDHLPVYADFITEVSTAIKRTSNTTNNFKLEQNYPNPFNPSTKIKYSIPSSVSNFSSYLVSLKVYDILGKEIVTLVNKYQNAGNYEVEFNASDFSNGVYFYTLKVGEYLDTKKMILIK